MNVQLKALGQFIWGEEEREVTHFGVQLILCFPIIKKQAEFPEANATMLPLQKKALSYTWPIKWKKKKVIGMV